MTMPEVVDFIDSYATAVSAPVERWTGVERVARRDDRFEVVAAGRAWDADTVVLASGGFNLANLPPFVSAIPDGVVSVTSLDYKRPDQLPEGGVLVVGASATGIQVASEIHASGRPVILAVGEHVRLPRLYRGKDILWWMEEIGRLDERYDEVDDLIRARHVPSPQLVGTPERATLDLNALTTAGVRLVGKFGAITDGTAHFSGSLRNVCALADLKLRRLLDEIDEWTVSEGIAVEVGDPERYPATSVDDDPLLSLDLSAGEIQSIVWATGYRADYSWLDIPVLDRKGEIKHDGGVVTDAPGLYRIGLNFLRRRKSSFIHGAEDDAIDLTEHLAFYLEERRNIRAVG
jgi:putative flavoprotein involved in K+ transport